MASLLGLCVGGGDGGRWDPTIWSGEGLKG